MAWGGSSMGCSRARTLSRKEPPAAAELSEEMVVRFVKSDASEPVLRVSSGGVGSRAAISLLPALGGLLESSGPGAFSSLLGLERKTFSALCWKRMVACMHHKRRWHARMRQALGVSRHRTGDSPKHRVTQVSTQVHAQVYNSPQ